MQSFKASVDSRELSASSAEKRRHWVRIPGRMLAVLIVGLLAYLAWNASTIWKAAAKAEVQSTTRYTCAICRADKTRTVYLCFPKTTVCDTACSKWYRENVEPSHKHIWVNCGKTAAWREFGLRGVTYCRIGAPDISSLSPDDQLAIYQRYGDKSEAKRLFIKLSADGSGISILGLQAWAEAGCPGSWEDYEKSWLERMKALVPSDPESANRLVPPLVP